MNADTLSGVPKGLFSTLGHPELANLLSKLEKRLVTGKSCNSGILRFEPKTNDERSAVLRFLGLQPSKTGRIITIDLAFLNALLKEAGLASTLDDAIQELRRETLQTKQIGKNQEQRWQNLVRQFSSRIRTTGHSWGPYFESWKYSIINSGVLKNLVSKQPFPVEAAECLLESAWKIIETLPSSGRSIAEVAARATGDSHALDYGSPVATLVLRAIKEVTGLEITDAESRRLAWASVGVVCEELSAPVLVFQLRGDGMTLTDRALNLYSDQLEPCRITLRQLVRFPPSFSSLREKPVYILENPQVIAGILLRLSLRSEQTCHPMVCLEGKVKSAGHLLLQLLSSAGAKLYYHGDFDPEGIQIANQLICRYDVKPWRLSSSDYLEFKGVGRSQQIQRIPDPLWDKNLKSVMLQYQMVIYEEAVIDSLAEDIFAVEQDHE